MSQLRENESKTLIALGNRSRRLAVSTIDELVQATGLNHSAIMRAVLSLESQNLVMVKERRSTQESFSMRKEKDTRSEAYLRDLL